MGAEEGKYKKWNILSSLHNIFNDPLPIVVSILVVSCLESLSGEKSVAVTMQ